MCEKVADDEIRIKIESVCANSQPQDFNSDVNFMLDAFTSEEKGHQKLGQASTSTEQETEELKDCVLDDTCSTGVKLDIGEYSVTSRYLNENDDEKELEEREAKFSEPRIKFSFCSDTDSDFNVEEHKIANRFLSGGEGNLCNNEELTSSTGTAKSIKPRIEFSFGNEIDYEDSDPDIKEQEIENQFIGGDMKLSQNNEPSYKLVDSTIVQDDIKDYDIIFNNAELIVNDLYDDADKNAENDAAHGGIEETRVASGSGVRGVHTCHTCNTPYTEKEDYLKHVQLFHAQSQRRKRKHTCKGQAFQRHVDVHADEKSSQFNIHDKRNNFKCATCDYECSQAGNFKIHVRTHTGDKPFDCTICDFKCSRVESLIAHLHTHTDEKPFKCTICDYKCSSAVHLKTHERTNPGHKPFRCTICDYRCSHTATLKAHKRSHTGEKPFRCTICDYKCSRAANLKTHVRSHTGDKPFKCTICDYKCSFAVHLKTHVRTHTGEKPFKCTICDYKCSQAGSLKTHEHTHTGEKPFKCTICDYKCSQAGSLKTHVRTHTGEKPFKCTICDYKCSQAGSLKTHVHTHTGEKPLKCTICDYKCSQATDLKRHLCTHR